MINRFATLAQRARNPAPVQVEAVLGFPLGLRTSVPPSMLLPTELAQCVNFQINRGGQLQTRPGLRKLNLTTLGSAIISAASAEVSGETFKLVQTEDFKIYRISDLGAATEIGTAAGKACMLGYGDIVAVADGGCIKYIDDSATIKLAWDGGDTGSMFNNLGDSVTGQVNYTAANNTQIDFTTPEWDSGFTLALTKLTVLLSKAGTGAVPTFTVYKTSDNSVVASGTATLADIVVSPGDFVDVQLTTTTELLPSTAYYIRLTTPAYNGTNYVSWYLGASSKPIGFVAPGLPPKANQLLTHGRRLWAFGDTENPGAVYFSNYTLFDWSTSGQGGYLTTIDDSKVTYPVGALASYYGNLYAYGTKEWPFFLKLCLLYTSDAADE